MIAQIIPKRYRQLSVKSLVPIPLGHADGAALSAEVQEMYIDLTRRIDPARAIGFLVLGPDGSYKSTLQAAWLIDEITRRVAASERNDSNICIWSIDAGSWLEDVEKWDKTPSVGRDQANPPLTPETLEAAVKNSPFRPILWVRNLQRIGSSEQRIRHVNALLHTVYKADGMIISSATWSAAELRRGIPCAATRSYFTGEREPDDRRAHFEVWDFHAAAEHTRRQLQKTKRRR